MWVVQLISPEWRQIAIIVFGLIAYFGSAIVLKEDLQKREWLTVLPVPVVYVVVMSLFYFFLPESFWSRIVVLGLFALGMYIILLSANIFLVAKERTIALLNTAQSAILLLSMLMMLFGVNTIWSAYQPYYAYVNPAFLVAFSWPLTLNIFWSVKLEEKVTKELIALTTGATFLIVSFGAILSFLPLQSWHVALLLMSFYYLMTGVVTMFLRDKLFHRVVSEYILIAVFLAIAFFIFFPWK